MGSVTKHLFGGEAIYTLVFGGVAMIIAGVLTLIVERSEWVKGFGFGFFAGFLDG